MWVILAPAAAIWFAAIVIANVARSPQDTLPPEFANPPTDTTDTNTQDDTRDVDETQDDNDQEAKAESPPDPHNPIDQC